VSDELVDLELAVHIVVDQTTHLSAALDTTECTSLPDATSNELEGYIIVFVSILGARRLGKATYVW
jgi:hypothetical protein